MRTKPIVLLEPLGRGGIADYTRELALALAGAGSEVVVATAVDHRYGALAGVRVHGVVRWLRGTTVLGGRLRAIKLGPAMNALCFAAALPALIMLGRRARLVHVQGFYFPPLLALAVALLRFFGVAVVHTPHNAFDRGYPHRWSRQLLAGCAGRTIVHARADVPLLPAHARPCVIPHGEYGALARSGGGADRQVVRRQLGLSDGKLTALLFGQLRSDKGIGDLLTAALALPELQVVLAGEDLGALDDIADHLAAPNLAGRIFVVEGFQEMDAAARLFAAADVVVLPYRRASQSGVLLLAYGFGRAVVVYPVGGLPEAVVTGETGWVCERPDTDALIETLSEVVSAGSQECLRRGAAGKRLAEQRYSWEVIARDTLVVYDQVVP